MFESTIRHSYLHMQSGVVHSKAKGGQRNLATLLIYLGTHFGKVIIHYQPLIPVNMNVNRERLSKNIHITTSFLVLMFSSITPAISLTNFCLEEAMQPFAKYANIFP